MNFFSRNVNSRVNQLLKLRTGCLITICILGLFSCEKSYICNCQSSIGEAQTTVSATSKKKARNECASLTDTPSTNESVTVISCTLND